jgi:hypothetical protein
MIAALFVQRGGVYFNLPNVDPWDVHRDATNYEGPYPVVAHPPCKRWSRFGIQMLKGHGFNDGKAKKDFGCFEFALNSVRKYGGVLEHPQHSLAFDEFGITKPNKFNGWDEFGNRLGWQVAKDGVGQVCQVEQGHYSHIMRKCTWLYVVSKHELPNLIWGDSNPKTPRKISYARGYARKVSIIDSINDVERSKTPIPFRNLLISIAENSHLTS